MNQICSACSKTVYPVEAVRIDGKSLHKTCFRCEHCKSTLSPGKYAALEGKFYCKPHFKQLFALKGNYSDGFNNKSSAIDLTLKPAAAANSISPSPIDDERSTDHSNSNTHRRGHSSREILEPHRVLLDGASQSQSNLTKIGTSNQALSERVKMYQEAVQRSTNSLNHRSVIDVVTSELSLNSSGGSAAEFGGKWAPNGSRNNLSESPLHTNHSAGNSGRFGGSRNATTINNNNNNRCQVCAKIVYPMEQVVVGESKMHKSCFRCTHCNSVLSLGKFAALDGKYYCKPHFKQLFALKGNYNEGFGSRPHKEKWQQHSTPVSSDLADSPTAAPEA